MQEERQRADDSLALVDQINRTNAITHRQLEDQHASQPQQQSLDTARLRNENAKLQAHASAVNLAVTCLRCSANAASLSGQIQRFGELSMCQQHNAHASEAHHLNGRVAQLTRENAELLVRALRRIELGLLHLRLLNVHGRWSKPAKFPHANSRRHVLWRWIEAKQGCGNCGRRMHNCVCRCNS